MEVLAEAMPVVCESVTSIIVILGAHRSAEVGLAKNICMHIL